MKPLLIVLTACFLYSGASAQNLVKSANKFLNTLNADQKLKTMFPFDGEDRYAWHFFPKTDRKGIPLKEMTNDQRGAAWELVRSCLTDKAIDQAKTIMSLESILKVEEKRADNDFYRDPENYYFTIYGIPGEQTTWGWRLEGHHLSYNFAADKNRLVSGTPAFTGSNPGIVQQGDRKGTEALHEQADLGYSLLASLNPSQLKKALFSDSAPPEIVTFVSKVASITPQTGISYGELNPKQQQLMLALINSYIERYTKTFAGQMKKEVQQADMNNLSFSWAGKTDRQLGNPHYYRVQGPTILIEYDNTQNNGNHVHAVLRDLKNDFGGDILLDHYRNEHK
jgi:hypothetical protein